MYRRIIGPVFVGLLVVWSAFAFQPRSFTSNPALAVAPVSKVLGLTTSDVGLKATSTPMPVLDDSADNWLKPRNVVKPPVVVPTPAPAPPVAPKVVIRPKVIPRAPVAPVVPHPVVASGPIAAIIIAAANRHGVDPNWMLKIARCESGMNPNAINHNGPYEGLFQFAPSTFRAHGGTNIWDPYQQSEITAFMLSHGGARAWSCA